MGEIILIVFEEVVIGEMIFFNELNLSVIILSIVLVL